MKYRWIGGALLAATLMLGACAPAGGAGQSAAPSAAAPSTPASTAPAESPSAAPSDGPSATPAPTPDDYEY